MRIVGTRDVLLLELIERLHQDIGTIKCRVEEIHDRLPDDKLKYVKLATSEKFKLSVLSSMVTVLVLLLIRGIFHV